MARPENSRIIKFSSDTKHRKQWFTGISFSHPAKMSLPLQLWIIDNFTKEGETILDPMAGSGTVLVACSMGRNVITLELEDKFVQMQKDNWEKVKMRGPQLGYQMGAATILQGDARNLEGLLVDKCIFSPPYAEGEPYYSPTMVRIRKEIGRDTTKPSQQTEGYGDNSKNIGNLPYGEIDKIVTSPPFQEVDVQRPGKVQSVKNYEYDSKHKHQGQSPNNIANLAERFYGSIDAVISSPPHGNRLSDDAVNDNDPQRISYRQALHKVDAVISSPPYDEGTGHGRGSEASNEILETKKLYLHGVGSYGENKGNIGNLKGETYLSAMLLVYQNCFAVLKDGGLMILVTKNFIRNKAQVRLDQDTIKLCEQAGFSFQDRWYRELASQSFWRTIYHQKYPDVEPIKYEDILVFQKELNG